MSEEILIQRAAFTPEVCTHWLLSVALRLAVSLVGIPLLPLMLSSLTVPLVGLVDSAVAGHLHAEYPLGAVALGSSLYTALAWATGFLRRLTAAGTAQKSNVFCCNRWHWRWLSRCCSGWPPRSCVSPCCNT